MTLSIFGLIVFRGTLLSVYSSTGRVLSLPAKYEVGGSVKTAQSETNIASPVSQLLLERKLSWS